MTNAQQILHSARVVLIHLAPMSNYVQFFDRFCIHIRMTQTKARYYIGRRKVRNISDEN